MTVSSTSNRKTFTGDGVTVAFGTSPVVFFDEGDLTIYTVVTATGVATLKTITTHYTVSGGAGSTGTVTMLTAPAVGETLVIVRELDLVQEVDFVNNEATDAEVAEDALDKLTMMAQQLSARLDRSFVLPDSDVSGASTEVPTPVANTLVGWNAAGTALENKVPADVDLTTVTAFIATLLDDADAATAQATLLLGTKSTVACAATTADIWTGTGTLIDFTGSTGPVTAFPAAPRAGLQRVLLCASTPTFTHGANLVVPGSANYTAAAGDIIVVTAETTTKFRLSIFKADGTPVVATQIGSTSLGAFVTMLNGKIEHSRGSNAETIAIKTLAGADPSASDPVKVVFRSATATDGGYEVLTLTAATSLTISSGSTLGFTNGVAGRLWIVGFNDGGTFRLGVINCAVKTAGAASIYPLAGWGIASATAEGGAGGADSAQVFYAGAGVVSKAYTVLGYSTWESGLAAVGTWDAAPTRTQLFGLGVPLPGMPIQLVSSYNASGSANNSTSYADVTNGSAAITPTSAANGLAVDFAWVGSFGIVAATNVTYTAQVLRGATVISGADSHVLSVDSGGGGIQLKGGMAFNYLDFPNATTAQTVKVQQKVSNTGGTGAATSAISRRLTEVMA